MPNHRWIRALCALVAAASLVAFTGCGGGDDKSDSSSNTSTTAPPATDTTASGGDTGGDTGNSGGDSGGGSVEEYKAGATKAANDFKNSAQAASQKVQSAQGIDGKIAGLDALKKSVTQAADDFEALNPPANVKADNAELVQEFRDLSSSVDEVEQALKTNDKSRAAAVLPKLGQLQGKIAQTISRIQTKIGS